ncbi:hypothetical protein NIES39_L03370 [Arthrospira platensis NIES-39]|nr:hypothetical protein NIES39_L03370 [Arthrospira platensis NIES-39]
MPISSSGCKTWHDEPVKLAVNSIPDHRTWLCYNPVAGNWAIIAVVGDTKRRWQPPLSYYHIDDA